MKKLLTLVCVFALVSSSLAQFIKNFGFKGGGTASTQKWEYAHSIPVLHKPDTKIGFDVGVFAEFLDLPFISLIGEVNYVEKGSQMILLSTDVSSSDYGEDTLWRAGFNYLNISLLTKVRLDGIIFTPYLIAGPKVDLEVSKDGEFITPGSIFNNFKKTRVGFKAGIGTEVKLFMINFLAEVLYDMDFGYLFERESFLKITSSSVDFRTGVSIGL